MRKPGAVLMAAAIIVAAAGPGLGADETAWGAVVNGVRLGIASDSRSEPGLRILLQNVGDAPIDVINGNKVGAGTAFSFRFIATSPEGKDREGFEIQSFTPIAGLTLPSVVRLDPGSTHELQIPLKTILCVEKPGDITFATLAGQRYSVHVSLETDRMNAEWSGASHPWIGSVTSGDLLLSN